MPTPRRLYIEPTTRCNLHCAMCVKHAPDSCIPEADLTPDLFSRILPDLVACDTVIFSGIGEPTLHSGLPDMLAAARQTMPAHAVLGVQTNGLTMSPQLAANLASSGVNRLCVSVDSLVEGSHTKDHDSSQLAGHLPAQAAGKALHMLRQYEEIQTGCQMVLQRNNAHELPAMVDWVAEQGGKFLLVSQLLPYVEAATPDVLFRYDTAEARAFFEQRFADALADGLDIRPYDAIMWGFNWSSNDRAVVARAQDIVREAVERGHPVHIRRLLRNVGNPLPADLPTLFAKAQRRAELHGLRLHLPRLEATVHRACPFLDEGWGFVSAEGNVSPCHYLWHEYACWPDGARKKVWPLFFGNVRETPLAELWAGSRWAEFRHDGQSYQFADCFACNGVCPDTNGKFGPFEVDCHARDVPCGHCPWCHGAVDCLRNH